LIAYDAPLRRFFAAALIAALPTACTVTPLAPPANPFVGGWSTAERQQIAFREDTVVLNPPGQQPTPLGAETCDGRFRFSYGRQHRESLLALVGQQADLRRRLAEMLAARPDYQVAEVSCGEGGTTYVMLSEKELVAIHRTVDIAGIERWSRP
jgi:hypothetical protein